MFNVLFPECFSKRKENRGVDDYSAFDFNCNIWRDFGGRRPWASGYLDQACGRDPFSRGGNQLDLVKAVTKYNGGNFRERVGKHAGANCVGSVKRPKRVPPGPYE